jgi:hypothetical protein
MSGRALLRAANCGCFGRCDALGPRECAGLARLALRVALRL